MHTYELVLPHGRGDSIRLFVGDNIVFTNPGEDTPVIEVKRIGRAKTRIVIRSQEEYLTAEDMNLLSNVPLGSNV